MTRRLTVPRLTAVVAILLLGRPAGAFFGGGGSIKEGSDVPVFRGADDRQPADRLRPVKGEEGRCPRLPGSISFRIVFDELDGDAFRVADPYGVAGTPALFIIDRNGVIRYSAVGLVAVDLLRKEIANVTK